MKLNLFKRYGFFVLGASIALNAFSEPVVESRSATSSSSGDYPFTSSSGDPEVVETTTSTTTSSGAGSTPASSGSANSNPYSAQSSTTSSSSDEKANNPIPADVPGNPVQSVNTFNAMQQDIQDLRGMVEELQYKLQQLEQQQKDRYIDVDRRLQALGGGAAAATASEPGDNDAVASEAASSNSEQEKADYDKAFNLMTKDKDFDKATTAFNKFVETYPNSTYTPNALYWLGKLYSFDTKNLSKARDAFQRVVQKFPTNNKASDALYELGVTYDKLGSKDQAKKSLKAVSSQYPGTGAAIKAEQYIKEKSL